MSIEIERYNKRIEECFKTIEILNKYGYDIRHEFAYQAENNNLKNNAE